MLPEFLVGTYRQYKQDTKYIATWLASTARSLGYSSESIPAEQDCVEQTSTSTSKSKNKSKPKTKKQVRDAARRIPKEQRKYTISIQEFLPLARYVRCTLTLPSRVPATIHTAIDRVMEARSETNHWFMAEDTTNSDKDGHEYFVNILREVKEILQPISDETEYATSDNGDEATLVDNIFESLEVNEVSQEFIDSPGTPQKDYTGERMLCEFSDFVFGEIGKILEEQLAASALFRDVHKIYDHVEQTWHQYKAGKIGLMAAAIISNTGIDLIRRLEEDFFEQFPQFYKVDDEFLRQFKKYNPNHRDAQQLLNFMYRAKSPDNPGDLFSPSFNRTATMAMPFKTKFYDHARYLFMDMLYMFNLYFVTSERMSKCVYEPKNGVWNPDSDYFNSTAKKKYMQDAFILAELLPDLTLLCTSLSKIPALAEDEVLRGTRGVFPHREENTSRKRPDPEVHLWWLTPLRLFCDIHHILGPNIGKPFEAIRRLGTSAKDLIGDCIKLRDAGELQCWPSSTDEDIINNTTKRIHQSLFVDEV